MVAPERDRVRVILTGEMDAGRARGLEAAAFDLINSGFLHLVLDLRQLSLIDTDGLIALSKIHARAGELSVRLEVRSAPGPVTQTLRRTGLGTLIEA